LSIAPDMFAYEADNHCYVTRQPASEAEIEAALRVVRAQELGCIRYGGTEVGVLRRLVEAGESSQCDHPPAGIEPVLRNLVEFAEHDAPAPGQRLLESFVAFLLARGLPIRRKRRWFDRASLQIAWFENVFHTLRLEQLSDKPERWSISHSGPLGLSEWLHDWLSTSGHVTDIKWWSAHEREHGGAGRTRPW
jgi:hypothetical protein